MALTPIAREKIPESQAADGPYDGEARLQAHVTKALHPGSLVSSWLRSEVCVGSWRRICHTAAPTWLMLAHSGFRP